MHESPSSPPNDAGRPDVEEFRSRGNGVSPMLIGFVLLAVAAVVFIVQNSDRSRVRFLFLSFTTRVWVGVVIALVLGALLDRLFALWWRRRRERT